MSGCVWEEKVALYAGGDLDAAEARAAERHMAECESCRALESGLRESLGMLREMHGEPVDEAHFAAVRARVLAELRPAPAWRWVAGWIAALAAVAFAVAFWPRPVSRMALPAPQAPAAPAFALVRTPIARMPAPARRPRHVERAETVLIKFETDNPDVVIYWIAETKGDTK